MLLTEKYQNQILGTISCYDRVILKANLSQWGYAQGMTSYAKNNNIKIFDFPMFAQSLRDILTENIKTVAEENNLKVFYIEKPSKFSKEHHIQKVLATLNNITEGIIQIYSVLEPCFSYRPNYDKKNHVSSLKPREGTCLHYYIYFIDKLYGLCYLRIPTYLPFRLQFYFNGHNLIANKMKKSNIEYKMLDNSFSYISDNPKAQSFSDNIQIDELHNFLNILTEKYLPFLKQYNQYYRWNIMQAEYSTDIIFKNKSDFQLFYQDLIYKVVLSVKPDNIATFLGKKLSPCFQGEIGNNFHNDRILGTRIKSRKGDNYIKIYDKFAIMLRIETTVNSVSDFSHYRQIDKKDGSQKFGFAKMKKNIYSLFPLAKLLKSSNNRYLEFISTLDDNSQGSKSLFNVSKPIVHNDHNLKGFNFFDNFDLKLLLSISQGAFFINGFRNKDIRCLLKEFSTAFISRLLKRLLLHRIIKKVKNTYKYYLTSLGKNIISTALTLKEFLLIPNLSKI